MKFVVTYNIGEYDTHCQHILPVEAPDREYLENKIAAAILDGYILEKKINALYKKIEPIVEIIAEDNISIIEYNQLIQKQHQSVKICGRYFPNINEVNSLEDMEILTVYEWFLAFEAADAAIDFHQFKGQIN